MQSAGFAARIAHNGFAIAEQQLDEAALELVRRRHADFLAIADSRDVRTSTSRSDTRVHLDHNFPGLRQLHETPLLRAVAEQVMKTSIALHYFVSRTLHPGASPQALHIDCDADAPALFGFIWMLDDFTAQNGATQFVAHSHSGAPATSTTLAIAPAGSLIMYNRSVLHGYTANTTSAHRRSIQGGFNPGSDPTGLTSSPDAARPRGSTGAAFGGCSR